MIWYVTLPDNTEGQLVLNLFFLFKVEDFFLFSSASDSRLFKAFWRYCKEKLQRIFLHLPKLLSVGILCVYTGLTNCWIDGWLRQQKAPFLRQIWIVWRQFLNPSPKDDNTSNSKFGVSLFTVVAIFSVYLLVKPLLLGMILRLGLLWLNF